MLPPPSPSSSPSTRASSSSSRGRSPTISSSRFEFHDVAGTIVGMRFPDHAGGIEASGYHLHFIDSGRRCGGHVLDCRTSSVRALIDPSSELRVELPPGVDLSEPHLEMASDEALRRVEGPD